MRRGAASVDKFLAAGRTQPDRRDVASSTHRNWTAGHFCDASSARCPLEILGRGTVRSCRPQRRRNRGRVHRRDFYNRRSGAGDRAPSPFHGGMRSRRRNHARGRPGRGRSAGVDRAARPDRDDFGIQWTAFNNPFRCARFTRGDGGRARIARRVRAARAGRSSISSSVDAPGGDGAGSRSRRAETARRRNPVFQHCDRRPLSRRKVRR